MNQNRMTFDDFLAQVRGQVAEVLPWEVEAAFEEGYSGLVLDVREEQEFAVAHVKGSLWVPRGILESAADHGFEDTVAELADAREKEVLVICRSGRRSLLAAHLLNQMGFKNTK